MGVCIFCSLVEHMCQSFVVKLVKVGKLVGLILSPSAIFITKWGNDVIYEGVGFNLQIIRVRSYNNH